MGNDVRMTIRISSEMAGELDKLAAVQGESRTECMRSLVAEGLLRRSEGAYAPLVAQAVRRETGALEEGIGERMAAIEDSLGAAVVLVVRRAQGRGRSDGCVAKAGYVRVWGCVKR